MNSHINNILLILISLTISHIAYNQCMTTGGFEAPEWSTQATGNWSQVTSEGTWTATDSYVNGGSTNSGSNKFGMNTTGDDLVTPAYTDPCDLSFFVRTSSDPDNWVIDVQVSTTPAGPWVTLTSVTENGTGGLITDAYTQITVPVNLIGTYYFRFFMSSRSTGSAYLDDISLTCGCASNTITIASINTAPFIIDCQAGTDDTGTVDFVSTGTFNAGNVYSVVLSDASGSFANPLVIGTLASTANAGTINITLPSTLNDGTNYMIQIVSSDPVSNSGNSAAFTITQSNQCVASLPSSQGLLINEWSNGDGGSREYYEFVVAGNCGDIVDISGYILDDNNGTFSTVFPSSSGIAPGHLRLTNDPQWQAIPVGSLIVIYNADDVNSNFAAATPPGPIADDLTDTNNDSLYVIPHNNTQYFEITSDLPDNALADSTYSPVTYVSTSWAPLGLRNAGDAIQVRSPNGAYWHGVSYGGAEMTGGPNNMKIDINGQGGNCGWFTDGDYLDPANWTTGSVAGNETPGLANNLANLQWLRAMRDPNGTTCPIVVLPVELSYFSGVKDQKGNVLVWETITEQNSAYFRLEHSTDGKNWLEIDTEAGAGNSAQPSYYSFVHTTFRNEVNYYRLFQVDFDGSELRTGNIVVIDNRYKEEVGLVKITNLMGQEIDASAKGVQIHVYSDGSIKRIYKP